MEEKNIVFSQREIQALLSTLSDFAKLADDELYDKRFREGLSQAWYKLDKNNIEHEYEQLSVKNLYLIERVEDRQVMDCKFTIHEASQKMLELGEKNEQYTLARVELVASESDTPTRAYLRNYEDGKLECESYQVFATSKPIENTKVAVIVEPGQHPCQPLNVIDELPAWQAVVGGYIEITYPLDGDVFVVGNEEARIVGLEGNRNINGALYAGNIMIAAPDDFGGTISLTPEQVDRYTNELYEPQNITPEEVSDFSYEIFSSM